MVMSKRCFHDIICDILSDMSLKPKSKTLIMSKTGSNYIEFSQYFDYCLSKGWITECKSYTKRQTPYYIISEKGIKAREELSKFVNLIE